MKCRHCHTLLRHIFLDLGTAPPSNSYLTQENLNSPEKWFPLRILVCEFCWLVQTEDFAEPEAFFNADYAYFSGFSTTWLKHAEDYVQQMMVRFSLNKESKVIEVAANDGYLLQYFVSHHIPCLGIEPTASTAVAARLKNIPIIEAFFGSKLAEKLVIEEGKANLMIANNVLAHVPDINDFVRGFSALLKPEGVATFEFPHLMAVKAGKQFDTIYHEHFSYLSFTTVNAIFNKNGLAIFDVELLPTHGGSLRVFAQKQHEGKKLQSINVSKLLIVEKELGMQNLVYYSEFQQSVEKLKNDFLFFLLKAKKENKKVVGYGAAAKGNTLLNFAGIRTDLIDFIVDRNPAKQGKYMPGSRIKIVSQERLLKEKPDYIIIFPWNLSDEVMRQLSFIKEWGGHFVTAIPALKIE